MSKKQKKSLCESCVYFRRWVEHGPEPTVGEADEVWYSGCRQGEYYDTADGVPFVGGCTSWMRDTPQRYTWKTVATFGKYEYADGVRLKIERDERKFVKVKQRKDKFEVRIRDE